MSTSRLETFSDGVFAIAATLLVLLFDVPKGVSPPFFAVFEIDMWVNHHDVMTQIGQRIERSSS